MRRSFFSAGIICFSFVILVGLFPNSFLPVGASLMPSDVTVTTAIPTSTNIVNLTLPTTTVHLTTVLYNGTTYTFIFPSVTMNTTTTHTVTSTTANATVGKTLTTTNATVGETVTKTNATVGITSTSSVTLSTTAATSTSYLTSVTSPTSTYYQYTYNAYNYSISTIATTTYTVQGAATLTQVTGFITLQIPATISVNTYTTGTNTVTVPAATVSGTSTAFSVVTEVATENTTTHATSTIIDAFNHTTSMITDIATVSDPFPPGVPVFAPVTAIIVAVGLVGAAWIYRFGVPGVVKKYLPSRLRYGKKKKGKKGDSKNGSKSETANSDKKEGFDGTRASDADQLEKINDRLKQLGSGGAVEGAEVPKP